MAREKRNVVDSADVGDLERVQELVLKDPRLVNYHRCDEITPLFKAVQAHHLGVAKFLLQRGAFVHCKDLWGDTPIVVNAKFWGNLPMLELLLEYGADPTDSSFGYNVLMLAAATQKHDQVARLLRHPVVLANIDAQTEGIIRDHPGHSNSIEAQRERGGKTALMFACEPKAIDKHIDAPKVDQGETIRLLLQAGADPTIVDDLGRTARSRLMNEAFVTHFEEWERCYMLSKARSLSVAQGDDEANRRMAFSLTYGEVQKAPRVKCPPPYLKQRLETGNPLPEVHVAVEEVGDNSAIGELDYDVLPKVVVKYVICGMPKELFTELTSLMM